MLSTMLLSSEGSGVLNQWTDVKNIIRFNKPIKNKYSINPYEKLKTSMYMPPDKIW